MKEWTFITHHAAVLVLLANRPRITALEIAGAVGVTERTVRMIINDLDEGGYIIKTREGRGLCYTVNTELPMRHPTVKDTPVGQFLEALGLPIPLSGKVGLS